MLSLCVAVIIAMLRLSGVFIHDFQNEDIDALDKRYVSFSGTVFRRDSKSYFINNIHFISDDSSVFPSLKKRAVILIARDESGLSLPAGSKICAKGRFQTFTHATNPGEFDQSDYYAEQGVIGRLKDVSICSGPYGKNPVSEALSAARENFEERLYKVFPDTEASILGDLLLGDRTGLDSEIKALYSRSGIAHILSISALHVSILGMGLYGLLRKLRVPVWVSAIAGAGVLILYGIMTGMSISAMRAIGMYIIRLGSYVAGRTEDRPTGIFLTCAVLAAVFPERIMSCGFLLSFGAVAGITFVSPAISSYSKQLPLKIAKTAVSSLNASFSAYLATLPIVLWFFYEVPVYGVFLNPIILPLMSVLMISALMAMLIPGAGILGTPAYFILRFFEFVCRTADRLPFHTWNPGKPAIWTIVIYYAFLIFVVLFKDISDIRSEKIRRFLLRLPYRLRRGMSVLLPAFSIIIMISLMALPRLSRNTLIMLDVGQGDGFIYYTDAREVCLFDGGSSSKKNVGQYVIKPALKYYGLSHIDNAFISHPDADHYSGTKEILENREDWGFKIDRVVLPECGLHNFDEIIGSSGDESHKKAVPVVTVCAGNSWKSGKNVFTCLHPGSDFEASDTNEMSECFLVDIFGDGSKMLLLTGDVQGEGEKALTAALKKDMDNASYGADKNKVGEPFLILKVAHHGSKFSSADSFLSVCDPQIALISAGKNNSYGHPHKEVLSRLGKTCCQIYRTDESGAVVMHFDQ